MTAFIHIKVRFSFNFLCLVVLTLCAPLTLIQTMTVGVF